MESFGEKVRPAKKRRMQRVQIFWKKPAPIVKSAPSGVETRYTMCRPQVSEIGAAMTGPSPSASTYVVRGRMETVELMPYCFSRLGMLVR
jgi:hypothetical protein